MEDEKKRKNRRLVNWGILKQHKPTRFLCHYCSQMNKHQLIHKVQSPTSDSPNNNIQKKKKTISTKTPKKTRDYYPLNQNKA